MTESEGIYAQHGPFGPGPTEQMDRYYAKLSTKETERLVRNQTELRERVRAQQANGTRPHPSAVLKSIGSQPSLAVRQLIVDLAAEQADTHGEISRNDQCVPFAAYVRAMLLELGLEARVVVGKATYTMHGKKHVLHHAWVELGEDVVDANVDSFKENFTVPNEIKPQPYWGPKGQAPNRGFKETRELLREREVVEIHDEFDSQRDLVLTRFRERLKLL